MQDLEEEITEETKERELIRIHGAVITCILGTIFLQNLYPHSLPSLLPAPVAFPWLSFCNCHIIAFLTHRVKTPFSENETNICRTPGAVHSAEMTCPLYDNGTFVKGSGKYQATNVLWSFFSDDKKCCCNLFNSNFSFKTLLMGFKSSGF